MLYNRGCGGYKEPMLRNGDWLLWCFIGLLVAGVLAVLLIQLAPEARLRRRRRKSHSRIVVKTNRPVVRLSVHPPEE
ncbi:hypothetical protein SBV1_1440040 [Verrucomicrobia bacterium]|nr:hypothetical protein SBV1_1440040 [Verrucomicrobiota bacterium]